MNLQQIKQKIKTSQSTVKITKVMQMVSTVKLQRMKPIINNSIIYKKEIAETLANILAQNENKSIFKNHNSGSKTALIITFSSDKGLCGSLNLNLCKNIIHNIHQLKHYGFAIKLKHIGNKAYDTFEYKLKDSSIYQEYLADFYNHGTANYIKIEQLSRQIMEEYKNGSFTDLFIGFNNFKSIIASDISFIDIKKYISAIHCKNLYKIDCDIDQITQFAEYQTIFAFLMFAINNNLACEHAFRMRAMDSATRNTNKIISELTTVFNKTRQSEITRNLIDIVAGAEAINS